jgi:thymidylate kinase
MSKLVYAIEGLDRLGKSTLVEGIQHKLGFFQVIHFSKPKRLKIYEGAANALIPEDADASLYTYQQETFRNSMMLSQSGARLIFDRWHLGEAVYSPLYRKYSGSYVFDMEKTFNLDSTNNVRLILLIEDFQTAIHFQSDGDSFDDTKREAEQKLFIEAFNRSVIQDKRIICVTDRTGRFKKPEDILEEATR